METLINIYNDDQSSIIINDSSTNLVDVQNFPTLGDSPFNADSTNQIDLYTDNNLYFLELHVFTEDGSLIQTLNSARPLLKRTSTGKYYFGPSHLHQVAEGESVYMVGAKHSLEPHETLEVVRMNQIIPYPLENQFGTLATQKFAIKVSEIFEVLKNMEQFTLTENTNFSIRYGVFTDMFVAIKNNPGIGQDQFGGGDGGSS
tara:strand:- start:10216 stop:10821 length:606 start_codon:yes stop_codon:yes gene_type:complete